MPIVGISSSSVTEAEAAAMCWSLESLVCLQLISLEHVPCFRHYSNYIIIEIISLPWINYCWSYKVASFASIHSLTLYFILILYKWTAKHSHLCSVKWINLHSSIHKFMSFTQNKLLLYSVHLQNIGLKQSVTMKIYF